MTLRAVAVWAVLFALAAAVIAWAVPRFGVTFVGGWSMAPTLCRGDLVIYRRDGRGLRQGDVAFVSKPGWPEGVLHRVTGFAPDGGLLLKGDANTVADRDATPRSAVRGVCVAVVPAGRAVLTVWRVLRRWYNLPSPST